MDNEASETLIYSVCVVSCSNIRRGGFTVPRWQIMFHGQLSVC